MEFFVTLPQRSLNWKNIAKFEKYVCHQWRSTLYPQKSYKKQDSIAGAHTQENSNQDSSRKVTSGFIWKDDGFITTELAPLNLLLDFVMHDKDKKRTRRMFNIRLEWWGVKYIQGDVISW